MLDSTYFYGFAVVHPIKKKRIAGVNIVGLIPGSDEINKFIVVSSHYDHLGELRGEIYNGADDNASGTAAMMAVAEYFQKHPPSHSILLVSFDGEESGLVGSRRFVEDCPVSLDSVVCNVNLDMVGRNSQNELYICGTAHYPFLKPILDETIELAAIDILYGHDGGFGADNWTMASDHANFHRKKIPFVYFGVEDHDDYHEPTDDFEKIVPEFYISAVEYIVQVIEVLDRKL
jgi:Zn-dependent M28 family amino/carboxypeptidase